MGSNTNIRVLVTNPQYTTETKLNHSVDENDQAGRRYWDAVWADGQLPMPVNPRARGFRHLYNRRVDAMFRQAFASMETRGKSLVEIGCARSAWLPYFGREFGFRVSGLDYSELGCEQERQILSRSGVEGEIVCADMLAPPAPWAEAFDVAVSFGVIEHFRETTNCLRALTTLVKPGGILITQIPNMTGLIGRLQKLMNPATYAVHVPLTREQLRTAHERAGLHIVHCDYFLSTGFGVVSLHGLDQGRISTRVKRAVLSLMKKSSVLIWALENATAPLPATRQFAPAIVCVARRAAKAA
ncbi:MAG TPA: class I SAM-dependent methyltransferase [Verrucomicrobiae bacterium]|nr:class I SAM-dependent methyltransferase [Verrucomicrobiae bacterium]